MAALLPDDMLAVLPSAPPAFSALQLHRLHAQVGCVLTCLLLIFQRLCMHHSCC